MTKNSHKAGGSIRKVFFAKNKMKGNKMSILNPEPGEFGKKLQENKAKAEQIEKALADQLNGVTGIQSMEVPKNSPLLNASTSQEYQGKMTATEVQARKQSAVNRLRQAAGLPTTKPSNSPYPDPGVVSNIPPMAVFGCCDHGLNPGSICSQCGEFVDSFGNTVSEVRYCQYPTCSCIVHGSNCAKKLQERKDIP